MKKDSFLISVLLLISRNKIILLIPLLFVVLGNFNYLHAQSNVTVTGTVKDNVGNILPGASVKVKGFNKMTTSDAKGIFKLTVPDKNSAILVISFSGYEAKEVALAGRQNIDVALTEIISSLNDVVVIGYGTAKRRDVVTSVGRADLKDMKEAPVQTYDQMLAGRVAGVVVTSSDGQPGAAASIQIRGSSISQSTSPLYVIDGFPVENMDMNSINPNDIETLDILKDPSSVAIYGSRGSNGVILITTKRGKSGAPTVSYSFNQNFQKDIHRVQMMNPYQFVKLQLELDSINSTPAVPSTRFKQIYLNPAAGIDLNYYKTIPGYDWQDLLLQTGKVQNHALNISGGNGDTRYSFSGSYYDQSGLIINTGMQRITGRFSLDQKLTKKLNSGISVSFSNSRTYGTIAATGTGGGVVQGMWQYRPTSGYGNQDIANALFDSTSMQDFLNGTVSTLGDNLINPLLQAQNEYRKTRSNTAYLAAYLEYSFLKNFKLRVNGGYNATDIRQDQFYNSQTQQGNLFKNTNGAIPNTNGINGNVRTSLAENMSSSNTITYNTNINHLHKIDALAGFEYIYGQQNGTYFNVINIPQATEYLGMLSLTTGTPAAAQLPSDTHNQGYSFFGRLNYNYASKYYLMAALREDGSSRFAAGHQWGYFPSFAAAWAFTEEGFMKKLTHIINYGKLRISYGATGNNRSGDFGYLSQFGAIQNGVGAYWNNTAIGGIQPYFYGNNALTWETTKGTDIGLNLEFLKGRISMEAIYYTKTTDNFLLAVKLPVSSGYGVGGVTQYQNAGSISNNGFEFTFTTININARNFRWTSNFNIAFNKSKVLSLTNGVENLQSSWSLPGSATAWVTKVGSPVSQFYGYKWGGVYQYADFNRQANGTYALKPGIPAYASNVQPGDPKYKDINGDGVVDANDQTVIGCPLPKHTGGFNNDFTYKNWSFNVFFQWSYGNDILNANRIAFESTGGYFMNGNQFASYDNRWTPSNPTNDIPRARYNSKGDAGGTNPRPTDRVIEDGSFLRLKTISIGYNLPASLIKKMHISNLRLNLSAQNIVTWTKYSGMDPEVSTYRSSNPSDSPFGGSNAGSTSVSGAGYSFVQPSSGYPALAQGYDFTPYPRAFIVNFGLNVTF